MRKVFSLLLLFIFYYTASFAQGFGLKEMLTFKDHDISFFHAQVKAKGYVYEKSKYDEKKENYAYVYAPDEVNNLREIVYTKNGGDVVITFATTEVNEYEQIKKDMELLQFKFVKFVPKQQHGRSVLMMVYTDGHVILHIYNSYMEDEDHELIRFYKVKVM